MSAVLEPVPTVLEPVPTVLEPVPTRPRRPLMTPSRLMELSKHTEQGCIAYWNYMHPIGKSVEYKSGKHGEIGWSVQRYETGITACSDTGKIYKCKLHMLYDTVYMDGQSTLGYVVKLYRHKQGRDKMELLTRCLKPVPS